MSKKPILGGVFIILGIVLLMKMLGLITFPVVEIIKTFWPVLLILIGLAMLFRERWLALSLVILLGIVLLLIPLSKLQIASAPQRNIVQTLPIDDSISSMTLDVKYGAGDLIIKKGSDYLVKNTIATSDTDDPILSISDDKGKATVSMERLGFEPNFGRNSKESWEIELGQEIPINLNLNYGAADVNVDLTGINVDNLDVNCGATETKITFANYPTKATIDTGASAIVLRIPKYAAAVITFSGGLASGKFEGFAKEGDRYYRNYAAGKDYIDIEIHAGASDVKTELI